MQLAAHPKAEGRRSMTASLAAPSTQWEVERSVLVDNFEADGILSAQSGMSAQISVILLPLHILSRDTVQGSKCTSELSAVQASQINTSKSHDYEAHLKLEQ